MGAQTSRFAKEYSNRRYDGEWIREFDGWNMVWKRHGKGTMVWDDGCTYTGDWARNEIQGYGEMVFPNGNKYTGQFSKNNPDGEGTLVTMNGERIFGLFMCRGRSDTASNAWNAPVAKYDLRVTVHDDKTNLAQGYIGPATIHVTSGLVVLPGMSSPSEPLFSYAIAVDAASSSSPLPTATAPSINSATQVPRAEVISTQQQQQNAKVDKDEAQSTPVVQAVALPTSAPGSTTVAGNGLVRGAPPQQAKSDSGEVAMAQAIPVNVAPAASTTGAPVQATGIAYGYNDPALVKRTEGRKINLLDIRNYF